MKFMHLQFFVQYKDMMYVRQLNLSNGAVTWMSLYDMQPVTEVDLLSDLRRAFGAAALSSCLAFVSATKNK